MGYYGWGWRPYVSVAERRRKAAREMEKRKKQGHAVSPVSIEGRAIARTFWGRAWCENLERYSDYANRLPRGRTYVRNGSVVDLQITPGAIDAYVSGSELYKVALKVAPVTKAKWKSITKDCAGAIDSLVELLQGRLSKGVMERICRQNHGLFPSPAEIQLSCSCPDWAGMCKHVAAVLYGIGARFDHQPELLFRLRAVDEMELIVNAGKAAPLAKQGPAASKLLGREDLSEVFGLDMAQSAGPDAVSAEHKPAKPKRAEKTAAAPEGKRKPRKQAASKQRRKRAAGLRKSQRPAEE
jgi:uncharacterized Zn finger protein